MRVLTHWALLAFALLGLNLSCAPYPSGVAGSPQPLPSAASAPMPSPEAGKAQVIFYRPRSAMGAAIRFNIEQSGQLVGQLLNGAVLRQSLSPGQHVFMVRAPSIDGLDSVTINAKAGQSYYVRGDVRVGWPAGRPKFTQVSPEQGRNEVARMP